jgi:hypothetical protein
MFRKLRSEREEIKGKIELVNKLLEIFPENEDLNVFSVGMKVLITETDGIAQEGRIISLGRFKGEWMVENNENVGKFSIDEKKLKIQDPSINGMLDRRRWLLSKRLNELDSILKDSELPEFFKEKELVNIKIIRRYPSSSRYNLIDCEVWKHPPVLSLKVPNKFSIVGDYLQLHIKDNEIFDIKPVSRDRYQTQE